MIRLDRLLVPTDFSELAAHAAAYARFLADAHRMEVHAIHVVPVQKLTEAPIPLSGPADMGAPVPADTVIETARSVLAKFVETELGGHAKNQVLLGQPYEDICAYADRAACNLIVIGTHAPGVMRRILLGSVSKLVLEHASCPVLMVPLLATV